MDVELILTWPPTINSYYVLVRNRKFISKKGKAFRVEVAEAVREQLGAWVACADRMLVEVILYPPDKRTRDLDNYMKALLDACTESSVWEDDSLIDQLFIFRGQTISGGRVVMRISPAGPIIPHAQKSPHLGG